MESQHSNVKRELMDARGKLGVTKAKRGELEAASHHVHDEHKALDAKRSDLYKGLFKLKGQINGLQAQKLHSQRELSNLLMEKRRLQYECDEFEQAMNDAQSKLQEAAQEKQAWQVKCSEAVKAKLVAEETLGKLEREKAQFRERCGVLTHEMSSQGPLLEKKKK